MLEAIMERILIHEAGVILKLLTLTHETSTVKANRLHMSLYEWSSKLFHPYPMNLEVIPITLKSKYLEYFKNSKQKLQKSWKDLFLLNVLDEAIF